MLEKKDIQIIERIIKEGTADLRQDISAVKQSVNILTQDMIESKEWQSKIGTKVEQIHDLIKFNIEITSAHDHKLIDISQNLKRQDVHENRITLLEKATKRKKSA